MLFGFFVADASVLISSEKEGLSLKAPDYGLDKLYYDGHRLEVFLKILLNGFIFRIITLRCTFSLFPQRFRLLSGWLEKHVEFVEDMMLRRRGSIKCPVDT